MNTDLNNWWIKKSYAVVATLIGAFVLGLLLLVFRDLDVNLRARLVPALVVYVLGASIVALWYIDLDARNCVQARIDKRPAGPQPRCKFYLFIALHIALLVLLVGYLFCKGVL